MMKNRLIGRARNLVEEYLSRQTDRLAEPGECDLHGRARVLWSELYFSSTAQFSLLCSFTFMSSLDLDDQQAL